MQNYRRLFFSAVLIVFLSISSLLPLNTRYAYACPVEPAPTLLQLYMENDLVFVADVISEEVLTKDSGSEYGDWAVVKKSVQIISVYKGAPADDLTFNRSEYFSRNTNETGPVTDGRERYNSLLPGNRYLIFLRKDNDSGSSELALAFASFRMIEAADEHLYDRRLKELASILKAKKGQLPALTEWLVKLIEEPKTLYDGTADIRNSFYRLDDPDEESEAGEEKPPFLLTEYSSIRSSHIAESLKESQKQRISAVLERQLQESLANPDEESESSVDYDLTGLVANWDLEQMTMRVNAMIQSSDPADSKRIGVLMSFINYAYYDDELSNLSYSYRNAAETEDPEYETANDENADEVEYAPDTLRTEATETVPGLNTTGVDLTEPGGQVDTPRTNTGLTETVVETETTDAKNQAGAVEEPVLNPEAIKLKRAKLMTRLVRKFSDRYQYLLARGFKIVDETETETETETLHSDRVRLITTTN